jgi:uncharacterized integral membrane protein (TIGR00698 family)
MGCVLTDPSRRSFAKASFWIALTPCWSPLLALPEGILSLIAPGALIVGITLALTLGNPYPEQSKKVSKTLLQAAVVLLGFSMNLQKIFEAGRSGLVFALVSISGVYLLGWVLQKLLKVRPMTSLLVSTGTAICGGSAIAAMSSVVDADQEDVSVAVGTVFLLNAIALVIFPIVGHMNHLTADQFGTWSGIAIHDVSSVVGAATAFGGGSLQTATAVKLSRVLFLVPITVIVSIWRGRSQNKDSSVHPPIPWFIGLFVAASVCNTYLPVIRSLGPMVRLVAISGFATSLFLIGGGITLKTLRAVGIRPMLQGVALWAFISLLSLFVVTRL